MSAEVNDVSNRLCSSDQLNNAIQPLLTDFYQISMAYAYWKNKKANCNAVFDLFFRKNPFESEFTIFAGLTECLKYLNEFKFTKSDIEYLRTVLPPHVEDEFYQYLLDLTLDDVQIHAIPEGSLVFPRVPLMTVIGPLLKVQLLETTLLVLVNYASLVTTNAARFRLAAGNGKILLEFGLRRAQGPDGGLSASKYCYVGGFDATSNVLAGKLYDIPIQGTNAHAFICSYSSLDDLTLRVRFNFCHFFLNNILCACLSILKLKMEK
jgi:nicotinate phosphoribosyltransferase